MSDLAHLQLPDELDVYRAADGAAVHACAAVAARAVLAQLRDRIAGLAAIWMRAHRIQVIEASTRAGVSRHAVMMLLLAAGT